MTDARHIKSEMGCIKYGSICHQNLKLISYNDLIFEVEVGSDRLLEHLWSNNFPGAGFQTRTREVWCLALHFHSTQVLDKPPFRQLLVLQP